MLGRLREGLQDVPISVSAMQGDKIQDAGIPNMAALADGIIEMRDGNLVSNLH